MDLKRRKQQILIKLDIDLESNSVQTLEVALISWVCVCRVRWAIVQNRQTGSDTMWAEASERASGRMNAQNPQLNFCPFIMNVCS